MKANQLPSDEVVLRILKSDVGQITESDIKLAESAKARLIGFRIKTNAAIERLAQQKKVKIATFNIIYELIQDIRESLSKLLKPEIIRNVLGQLKVLAVFRTEKDKQIIGGRVTKGIAKKVAVDILRNGDKIEEGRVIQLQKNKKESDEVNKDQEAGLLVKGTNLIEKGDTLEFYEEEKKKREL